jgi:hypothetical protein
VHTGLAVITGTEDRQHAVALTRGTEVKLAYVFTISPKRADPAPGPRPAPELARFDKIYTERAGVPAPGRPACPGGHGARRARRRTGPRRPAAVGHPDPPPEPRHADHLAVLHAIWTAETTPARQQHYHDLLMDALPPGHRAEPGRQARWLWRALYAAELAGLDPTRVLASAIAERDLAGARDIPAVLDTHLRAVWARAWSANYAALEFLQDTGLSRFSTVKPQRWVVASFEHHCGPHGLPRPHIHNIVIAAPTKYP